jgi:hypothetical protein
VFYHSHKYAHYTNFDYDFGNKILLTIEHAEYKLHLIIPKKEKPKNPKASLINDIEIPNCHLIHIKIIKELKVLIGGDDTGNLIVYNWPFRNYDTKPNLAQNIKSYLNLDTEAIKCMVNFRNYHSFIVLLNNSTCFLVELLINKYGQFTTFEYFSKRIKPQTELLFPIYSFYELKKNDILDKEQNVKELEKCMKDIKVVIEKSIENLQNEFQEEFTSMENTIKISTEKEEQKLVEIEKDLVKLKEQMGEDMEKKITEMLNERAEREKKNKENIDLYNKEIKRLKNELKEIRHDLENTYTTEIEKQNKYLNQLIKEHNEKFEEIKNESKESLMKLIRINGEYDEATDTIIEDYKKLIGKLDQKIQKDKEYNEKVLKERKDLLLKEQSLEDEHKIKLEEKVRESDKLIEKNVEIKQNIIVATQKTITFQEQLIETEKNIIKIDKKLENLIVKNKHLEQVRFVLEHRMTSLEKEKVPLEGQCGFLESQKNKLTEEFNKIILKINANNQELENRQNQLRASLIQNYEAIDQKIYLENRINELKKNMNIFIEKQKLLLDGKATKLALDFRQFYDKYFTGSIEKELDEYLYYSQKLEEEKDQIGILNINDLLIRNNGEDRLIREKNKVNELRNVKEIGYIRMQADNTVLIAECNSLRKNLHEIYTHVLEIERKFEKLTNIDPNLPKNQIVQQIKDFIRQTHEKIKANYSQKYRGKQSYNRSNNLGQLTNKNPMNKRYINPINNNTGTSVIKNLSVNNILVEKNNHKDILNLDESKRDNDNKEDNKKYNEYANIIEIKKINREESLIMGQKNIFKKSSNNKFGKLKLPAIKIKK